MPDDAPPLPPLEAIQSYLEDRQQPVSRGPVLPESSAEQLLTPVYEDENGRVYILQLLFINDLAPAPAEDEPRLRLLQHFCALPMELDLETALQVGRFLHFVNLSMPLGTYGIQESAPAVYFRCVLSFPRAAADELAAVGEVITALSLSLPQIVPAIEAIQGGRQSAADAMQAVAVNGIFR